MAAQIGSLRVTLGADTASFQAGMTRAQRQAAATGQSITRSMAVARASVTTSMAGISSAISGFGIITALGGAALGVLARQSLSFAADLGETSRQIGVTVEQLQILQRMALENGVSSETLERGMQRLTRTLGEAKAGAATAREAFAALGITQAQLNSWNQGGDAIREVAERIMRIPDPARQAAAAVQLFSRNGQQLLPLLSSIATGYDDAAAEARRMGLVTEEQAAKADEANDRLDALAYTLQAKLAVAVSDNVGPIMNLANAFVALANNLRIAIPLATTFAGIALGSRLGPWGAVGGGIGGYLIGSGVMHDDAAAQVRQAREQRDTRMRSLGADPRNSRSPGFQRALRDPEVLRHHRAMRAAEAEARSSAPPATPPALSPTTDIPPLDYQSGGGGGRSRRGGGRSGRDDGARQREQAVREEAEFQSNLRGFRRDILRAQQEQTSDTVARSQFETQLLDLDREEYAAQLATQVQLGDLTQARAAQLQAAYDQVDTERRQAVTLDQRRQVEEENRAVDEDRYQIAAAALRQEVDLADTAAERRAAELRLLDLTHRHERAKLEELASAEGISRTEQMRAQAALAQLDASQGRERQSVLRVTMGPMEQFMSGLPSTAEQVNEAMESIAANGLQSITDGLTEAIMMTKSWGDTFKNIAKSIIADLIRIQIQRSIIGPLSNALGGLFGGGGSATDIIAGKLGKRAAGGPVIPGRAYIVGERGPELLQMGSSGGHVVPNHELGGGGARVFHFDLRGAVMTQDLLNQMNQIGAAATVGGAALAQSQMGRRASRRLA